MTAQPSDVPSSTPSASPTLKPAGGDNQPQCDCRKYWYHGYYNPYRQHEQAPGAPSGKYGYSYGYQYGYQSKGKGGKAQKGSKKGSGYHGWRQRKLPGVVVNPNMGAERHPSEGINPVFHYDPCWYYCQWVIHQAIAYGVNGGHR